MAKNSSSFSRFFKRCNIIDIIKGHYDTFYDYATKDKCRSGWEIFWQILFFVFISLILTYFGLLFTRTALNSILTVQAILTPFLFSTLFIVADKRSNVPQGTKKYRLIDDTTKNISFNMLLSIILIIITVVYLVCLPDTNDNRMVAPMLFYEILSTIMYCFILNQLYVFVMIMKRVGKMID